MHRGEVLPTHAELVDELQRIVSIRLLDPLEILLAGDESVEQVRHRVSAATSAWAEELLTADDQRTVHLILRLVSTLYSGDGPFDPPADWWRTPLGQVLAHRVGHPTAAAVSYPVAGAMLGITRQGVHDLVRRDKLASHPDGGVLPSSVRDRLRQEGTRADVTT